MFAEVHKARSDQDGLLGSRESVSVVESVADRLGVGPGAQVRIRNTETDIVGAYTIRERHGEDKPPVRMAKAGRDPLNADPGFEAELRSTVPRNDLSHQAAWRADECTETVWHDPGTEPSVAFLAPHGGDAERNTDESAVFASKAFGLEDCSTWVVHNFGPGAFRRWHVTSSRIAPVSYPDLQRLDGYGFERAVSFHLWDGTELLVGGLADRSLREDLGDRLAEAVRKDREMVTEGGKYMGDTESNVVNWLTDDSRSGIQIEAPAYTCQRSRKALGEAVAEFLAENV